MQPYKINKSRSEKILKRAYFYTNIEYSLYRITESGQIVVTTMLNGKCKHMPVYKNMNVMNDRNERNDIIIFNNIIINKTDWDYFLINNYPIMTIDSIITYFE